MTHSVVRRDDCLISPHFAPMQTSQHDVMLPINYWHVATKVALQALWLPLKAMYYDDEPIPILVTCLIIFVGHRHRGHSHFITCQFPSLVWPGDHTKSSKLSYGTLILAMTRTYHLRSICMEINSSLMDGLYWGRRMSCCDPSSLRSRHSPSLMMAAMHSWAFLGSLKICSFWDSSKISSF